MSMIHYRAATLDRVIATADTIVLARFVGSDTWKGTSYRRFEVQEVLHQHDAEERAGLAKGAIRVFSAGIEQWTLAKRLAESGRGRRSPLVLDFRQEPPFTLEEGSSYVLFLQRIGMGPQQADFQLAARDAFLPPSRRNEVDDALTRAAQQPPAGAPQD